MKFDLAAWGAELSPDRSALWFDGRWYTYRELNERATRLANRLALAGIGFGARIGILAGNHLAHFDLLFAAPKLGFILVPFDPGVPVAELREQARATRPELLFCEAHCDAIAAQAIGCPRLVLEQYSGWLGHSSRQHVGMQELSPESIQMILFTDGAAGPSRAVLIPYRQTLANAQATATGWNLGPEDCAIQAAPCFDAAINVLSTPLLTLGGRVVLMNRFDPGEYLRLAQQLGVTVMFLLPGMYEALIAHPDFAAAELRRVRWATSGGAPCPASVADALLEHGIPFHPGYGRTEAGVNCFVIDPEESARHPGSVGRPMWHLQMEIRRPDGSLCAANETGELTLSGEGLCSGYLAHGEEWQAACRDGWFRTGDLATRDDHGRYYLRRRGEEQPV